MDPSAAASWGRDGATTRLVDGLETLALAGEIARAGHWARLPGERCPVYLVEVYRDPIAAIHTVLAGAARSDPG